MDREKLPRLVGGDKSTKWSNCYSTAKKPDCFWIKLRKALFCANSAPAAYVAGSSVSNVLSFARPAIKYIYVVRNLHVLQMSNVFTTAVPI